VLKGGWPLGQRDASAPKDSANVTEYKTLRRTRRRDEAVPARVYLDELAAHGICIEQAT
jgi:hypothetical protein